jgi:hypothetical protein
MPSVTLASLEVASRPDKCPISVFNLSIASVKTSIFAEISSLGFQIGVREAISRSRQTEM